MSDTSDKPDAINAEVPQDLRKYQTAESVLLPISRDTFEKLYLNPKNPRATSKLSKRFGNPTPISLLGFLLASMPNAMIMMGWRGAGGHGGAIMYDLSLLRETELTVSDLCIFGLVEWSRFLAQLENGLLGIHFPALFSSLTVSCQLLWLLVHL